MLRLSSLEGNENLPRPFNGYLLEKLARLLSVMSVVECGIPIGEVDTMPSGRATTSLSPASASPGQGASALPSH